MVSQSAVAPDLYCHVPFVPIREIRVTLSELLRIKAARAKLPWKSGGSPLHPFASSKKSHSPAAAENSLRRNPPAHPVKYRTPARHCAPVPTPPARDGPVSCPPAAQSHHWPASDFYTISAR